MRNELSHYRRACTSGVPHVAKKATDLASTQGPKPSSAVLAASAPRGVVPLGDSDATLTLQKGKSIDGYSNEEQLDSERVTDAVVFGSKKTADVR